MVVVLVGMQLVRLSTRSATSSIPRRWNGIQCGCQHLAVVLVGGIGQDVDWCAWDVDDQVAFATRPLPWCVGLGPMPSPLLAIGDALSSAAQRRSICPAACRRSSDHPASRISHASRDPSGQVSSGASGLKPLKTYPACQLDIFMNSHSQSKKQREYDLSLITLHKPRYFFDKMKASRMIKQSVVRILDDVYIYPSKSS